jgi:DNA-binding CsgD family transcriptional regulator
VGCWPLIGRDEELELLRQVVAGSGSVVVSGDAGVGKSRLVADFLELLPPQGVRAVRVRATRSTATIPFGPFASWAPDRGDHGGMASTDRLQVLRSISRALLSPGDDQRDQDDDDPRDRGDRSGRAGDDPGERIVVAVDDAHLLDDGSAALLLHLAAHTPAQVVATVRSGEPCADGVVALWKEGLAELVELQPLSEIETVELAEQALGGPIDAATRRRLWTLTEGIPLYLREVLSTGTHQGLLTYRDGVWRWRGGFRRCRRLSELVGDRLDRVSGDERRVLELVAFGEPLPVELVVELGGGQALAETEERGLVVVDTTGDTDDQPSVRFAHPLYGEILRADLPVLVGRAHQRALATAALARGWQAHDPLRVASWWLAGDAPEGEGDPEMLLAATQRALAVGDWELVDRLGRAAEAAGAGARATLLRASGLVSSQQVTRADELLATLFRTPLDDDRFVDVARARADILFWQRGDHGAARRVLALAGHRVTGPARSRLLCHRSHLATFARDPAAGDRLATRALEDAGPVVALQAQALATAAFARVCLGRTTEALEGVEKALPDVPDTLEDIPNSTVSLPPAYALALVLDGRIDEARAVAEHTLTLAHRDGPRISQAVATALVGRVALFQGRPARAQQAGRDALALIGETQMVPHWPAAVLAYGAAQTGDPAAAERALDVAGRWLPIPLKMLELDLAAAWTAAARDDLPTARRTARDTAGAAAAAGVWLFEMLALVDLVRFGEPDAAVARLTELTDMVEGPYAATAADYARAAAGADGPGLDHVSERFEAMGAQLLAAEAAAGATVAHRTAGRTASATRSLARARRLAARCEGARTPALRQLDRDPLLHILTRREREVIELAGRGLSNREIATTLYISLRTVNAHLNHAYAKLGTRDRHEVGDLLPMS